MTKGFCELGDECRAGRCDEFEWLIDLGERNAGKNLERGGSGEGEPAVGAVDESRAFEEGGRKDAVDAQSMDADAKGDDVDDGINGADFVEGDFVGGHSVNLPLGDGDAVKDGERPGLNLIGQRRAIDEVFDLGVAAPVIMPVRCSRGKIRNWGDGIDGLEVDVKFRAGDVLAGGAVDAEFVFAGQSESSQIGFEVMWIETEVDECGDGHVAADTGKAVEEESGHGRCSKGRMAAMKFAQRRIIGNALAIVAGLGVSSGAWAAVPTVAEMNETFGAEIWTDENLWDDADAEVAERLEWPRESETSTDSSFRRYSRATERVLGSRPFSLALYGEGGKADRLSMVFANKGDIEELLQVDPNLSEARAKTEVQRQLRDYKKLIAADANAIATRLTGALGEPANDKFGQGRNASERVMRWDWQGHAILLAAPEGEYVALRIVPTEVADGEGVERVQDTVLRDRLEKRVVHRPNGDVILSEIPMVDQGPKGYCVPATWERALRYLGIEADMYSLAMAGSTKVGGGTSLLAMQAGVNDLVRQHGRRMDTSGGRITMQRVAKEIDDGLPIMWAMIVVREVDRAVTERSNQRESVTDWDAYRKLLEPYRKNARSIRPDRDNGHMCMIVGYNEETDEIAVSDSWGPSYAERWITEEEANAISQGQFTVINW